MSSHGEHDSEEFHAHVLPLKIYFGVWAALTALTIITVAVSYVNFNELLGIKNVNLVVAMIVAVTKASLVATFFMHLKYDNKLNAVAFTSSLVFLSIFFFLTFADLMTRGRVDEFQGTFVKAHGLQPTAPVPSAPPHH
jgi:cytochrome c oxidase subunit 4